ncbi:MAG: DUF3368 domain-containing protein [Planctomycetota bacterium]
MLVVSDATPLNILIRTQLIHVLPELYQTVAIPPAVERELSHPHTPQVVRDWLAYRPAWLETRTPAYVDERVARHAGEREAICLALEIKADVLLVDDLKARATAERLGLKVAGTLGVLELAAEKGIIDLKESLRCLCVTDFFLSDHLIQAALDRDAQRHQTHR